MIRLVQGADAHRYPREMDAMFRARAAVFSERLGWNVTVVDGRETDRFDASNPLYLIAIDDLTGAVCGSLRLLPTTGPNMLKECFAELFDEPVDIESGTIWECTRFCLHPNVDVRTSATGAMRTTWELMLGICEVGLRAGISQILRRLRSKYGAGIQKDPVDADADYKDGALGIAACLCRSVGRRRGIFAADASGERDHVKRDRARPVHLHSIRSHRRVSPISP